MFSRKTVLVVGALLLSGASSMAYAAELGAESIVDEQAVAQRALAEQEQYQAYHQHFKELRARQGADKIIPAQRN